MTGSGRRARRPGLAASLTLILLVLLVPGCGDGAESEPADPGRPVVLAIVDKTSSFTDFAPDCVPDLLKVAETMAERQGSFYAGALLSGDPQRELISVSANFDEKAPPSVEGNDELEANWRRDRARKLRSGLERLTRERASTDGSPVFRVLERAAAFRDQRVTNGDFFLILCTDLANVGDGIDVRESVADAQVHQAAARWRSKLTGLRGSRIYIIGAGRLRAGSPVRPESIDQVRKILVEIFRDDIKLVDTQLGPDFPVRTDPDS